MDYREEFLQIWHQHVSRPGSEKLLDWLDNKTDFFSAPASTRFHGACDGGLCMHSLNVYHALHDGFFTEGESEESYAICALLHDLCKANYYKKGTRNVKNDATGQWEKVPSYSVEDLFPYGHGEKSVFLIERFMKLKVEEAVAIRWHMGGFDDAAKGGCFAISEAYDKYPLAVKLHIADLKATYLMEHRTNNSPHSAAHWSCGSSAIRCAARCRLVPSLLLPLTRARDHAPSRAVHTVTYKLTCAYSGSPAAHRSNGCRCSLPPPALQRCLRRQQAAALRHPRRTHQS